MNTVVGLTEAEAQRRLQSVGPNELPKGETRSPAGIVGQTLREPTFMLLVGAAALYLALFAGRLAGPPHCYVGEAPKCSVGLAAPIPRVIDKEIRDDPRLPARRSPT